jgi:hypothetical protein
MTRDEACQNRIWLIGLMGGAKSTVGWESHYVRSLADTPGGIVAGVRRCE